MLEKSNNALFNFNDRQAEVSSNQIQITELADLFD